MRALFGLLAAAVLVAGALVVGGEPASAAPVNTDAVVRVDLGALGSFTVPGAGVVDITGEGMISGDGVSGSKVVIPEGLVSLPNTVTIVPNSTLVNSVVLKAGLRNLAGTISVDGVNAQAAGEICTSPGMNEACLAGGGVGGILPLAGEVTANIGGILAPVNLQGLNFGAGGAIATGLFTGDAAPFTTGTGLAATANNMAVTDAQGLGDPLTLVTPVFLGVPLFGTALALFAEFELTNVTVPEPGSILLQMAGLAGLVAVALWRRRR